MEGHRQGVGGGGNGELFNGYGFSVEQDEKVLDICCTTTQTELTLPDCTFENTYGGQFCYVFFTIKNIF